MATSLSVSEETRDELQMMKIKGGHSSIDALLCEMMVGYRKQRLMEVSRKFRKAMDRKGLKLEDLYK